MNKVKIFFLCSALLFITGCATWTKIGGAYHHPSAKYSVDLPWGWMKFRGKDLLISRDGFFLEIIEISRLNIKEKLKHTKKKFIEGMLAEEIAEVLIDDIILNPDFHGFELIENVSVTLSGQESFRLIYAFHNQDGLKYRAIKYGFGYKNWVYTLLYSSTVDYYYDKYLKDFNDLINSFKFLLAQEGKTVVPPLPISKRR